VGAARSNAAAHDRQLAVLRSGLAAGDRRIDEEQTLRARDVREFAGDVSRGGGVINKGRATRHARQCALVAEGDAAQIVVVAHAC
jgi:hypothetical protein